MKDDLRFGDLDSPVARGRRAHVFPDGLVDRAGRRPCMDRRRRRSGRRRRRVRRRLVERGLRGVAPAPSALEEHGDEQAHGRGHTGHGPEGPTLAGSPIGIGVHRENSPYESRKERAHPSSARKRALRRHIDSDAGRLESGSVKSPLWPHRSERHEPQHGRCQAGRNACSRRLRALEARPILRTCAGSSRRRRA